MSVPISANPRWGEDATRWKGATVIGTRLETVFRLGSVASPTSGGGSPVSFAYPFGYGLVDAAAAVAAP
jgi:hypothetical protein